MHTFNTTKMRHEEQKMTIPVEMLAIILFGFILGHGPAIGQYSVLPDRVGPGIAGQIHAMTYDPADSTGGTIYVGGDNCGVYKTTNGGWSWELFNEGLVRPDIPYTSYVDDLLVLGEESGLPEQYQGVYAATQGGIFFRQEPHGSWAPLTESLTFTTTVTDSTPISPNKIPFSSLAFDSRSKVLYAGAGHARYDWDDEFYPNLPSVEGGDQFSLWKWEFLNSAGFESVSGSKNTGLVRQVAIVERGVNAPVNDVAYVTNLGVHLHRPDSGSHPVEVWISANKQSVPLVNRAEKPWGVAAGRENVLYALMVKEDDEPSTVPGVWRTNLTELDINNPPALMWDFVGDPEGYVPPRDTTWVGLFSSPTNNLICLSVIPGPSMEEDQIFVGERVVTTAQGFYRYGPFNQNVGDGDVETVNGWIQILGINGTYAGGLNHFFTDYHDPSLELYSQPLEFGWGERVPVASTTPLIVHPHNPNLMAAAIFGNMVVSFSEGRDWTQVGAQGSEDNWSTTGLDQMAVHGLGFLEDGTVAIGCLDWSLFKENSPGGGSHWRDEYHIGGKNVADVEALGDEILVVRDAPSAKIDVADDNGAWSASYFHDFGFPSVTEVDEDDQVTLMDIIPKRVIAISDPTQLAGEPIGPNGFGWRFISQDIGQPYNDGVEYTITDAEVADTNRVFAACNWDGDTPKKSRVYELAHSEGGWIATEILGESVSYEISGKIQDMEYLPSANKLLVASEGAGLHMVDLDEPENTFAWFVDPSDSNLNKASSYPNSLTFDEASGSLFVGTSGLTGIESEIIGTALWLNGSVYDYLETAPPASAWVMLANADAENTFNIDPPMSWGDWYPDGVAHKRLTNIRDIAIHPDNPRKIYAGFGQTGLIGLGTQMFEQNGVWECDLTRFPDVSWTQLTGGSHDGECNTGVLALGFRKGTWSQNLVVGTAGQGTYSFDAPGVPVPQLGEKARYALPLYTVPQSDDPHPLLAVKAVSTSGVEMVDVRVDCSSIGLGNAVALSDSATNGDLTASDGVWSAELPFVAVAPGEYELPVIARDGLWNTFNGSLSVLVADARGRFVDRSSSTGDLEGIDDPQSVAIPCDFDGDSDQDILVFTRGGYSKAMRTDGEDNGAPYCFDVTQDVFNFLADEILTMVSADLDNDGDEDVFACPSASPPIMYCNQDSSFFEGTSSTFADPAAIPDRAFAAAWGDYDCDGWVDLAVLGRIDDGAPSGYPDPDGAVNLLLYHNVQGVLHLTPTSSIIVVGEDLAGQEPPVLVKWMDLNNDSKPDLFLTGSPSIFSSGGVGAVLGAKVLINKGFIVGESSYSFMDATDVWFGPPLAPNNVIAAQFEDWDGDGDQDLVVGKMGEQDNLLFFRNTGSCLVAEDVSSWWLAQSEADICDLVAADYDLNGEVDLVVVSRDNTVPPRLLLNQLSDLGGFVEFCPSGIEKGYFGNGFSNTWGSGKPALYLGKRAGLTQNSGKVYTFERAAQADSVRCFRVAVGHSGPTNSSGLGTKVAVEFIKDGELEDTVITRWVKSSSGGRGQSSRVLEFGISDYSGNDIDVAVTWPDGYSPPSNTISLGPDDVQIIDRSNSGFGFVPQHIGFQVLNATGAFLAAPDNANQWRFTFDATQQVSPEVVLYADYDPLGCLCMTAESGSYLYAAGDSGVEIEVYPIANGVYRHVMTVPALCCEAYCSFEFEITGRLGDQVISSGHLNTRTGAFCLGGF